MHICVGAAPNFYILHLEFYILRFLLGQSDSDRVLVLHWPKPQNVKL